MDIFSCLFINPLPLISDLVAVLLLLQITMNIIIDMGYYLNLNIIIDMGYYLNFGQTLQLIINFKTFSFIKFISRFDIINLCLDL